MNSTKIALITILVIKHDSTHKLDIPILSVKNWRKSDLKKNCLNCYFIQER